MLSRGEGVKAGKLLGFCGPGKGLILTSFGITGGGWLVEGRVGDLTQRRKGHEEFTKQRPELLTPARISAPPTLAAEERNHKAAAPTPPEAGRPGGDSGGGQQGSARPRRGVRGEYTLVV